jgi:hypothetical protein
MNQALLLTPFRFCFQVYLQDWVIWLMTEDGPFAKLGLEVLPLMTLLRIRLA